MKFVVPLTKLKTARDWLTNLQKILHILIWIVNYRVCWIQSLSRFNYSRIGDKTVNKIILILSKFTRRKIVKGFFSSSLTFSSVCINFCASMFAIQSNTYRNGCGLNCALWKKELPNSLLWFHLCCDPTSLGYRFWSLMPCAHQTQHFRWSFCKQGKEVGFYPNTALCNTKTRWPRLCIRCCDNK